MNDPIVSPWLIYLLGRVEPMSFVFIFTCIVSGVTAIALAIYVGGEGGEERPGESAFSKFSRESANRIGKRFRWVKYVAITTTIIAMFLPSKSDLIAMMVAKNITPSVVKESVKTGKEIKDDIVADIVRIIEAAGKDDGKEGE